MSLTVKDLIKEARKSVPEVDAEQAKKLVDGGRFDLILDVREPGEVAGGMLPGAHHIPRGELEFRADAATPIADQRLIAAKQERILVHCARGLRSLLAAETLKRMGYEDVTSLDGGFVAWNEKGFPVEVPRR